MRAIGCATGLAPEYLVVFWISIFWVAAPQPIAAVEYELVCVEDVRVTNTSEPSSLPTLSLDPEENVYVTWAEGPSSPSGWYEDLFYAMFDDTGSRLRPNTKLGFPGKQGPTALGVDSGNNLHVVWHNMNGPAPGEEIFHRVVDAGGVIGAGTQMTSTPSRLNTDMPLLVVDANDDLYVVYQDEVNDPINGDGNKRRDLFYKRFHWNGSSLTPLLGPVELTTDDGTGFPNVGYVNNLRSMAVDPAGDFHVLWADWRDYSHYDDTEVYYLKFDRDGNTLVPETRLTSVDGQPSRFPYVAVDVHGDVHIVWEDRRNGNTNIYYKKLDNGGNTVVDDLRLTSHPADSTNPAVAIDSSGNLNVLWQDHRSGHRELYFTYLDAVGNTLLDHTLVTADATNPALMNLQVVLAIDSRDRLHMTWRDWVDGTTQVYYKQCYVHAIDSALEIPTLSSLGLAILMAALALTALLLLRQT